MDSNTRVSLKDGRFPFFSLPREIRDEIYRELFVSKELIKYDPFGYYLRNHGVFSFLNYFYEPNSNSQFAQEALEMFFQENTFNVDWEDLAIFFGLEKTYFPTKDPDNPAVLPLYEPSKAIEMRSWIKTFVYEISNPRMDFSVTRFLETSKFPRMRTVIVWIGSRDVTLEISATVLQTGHLESSQESLGEDSKNIAGRLIT